MLVGSILISAVAGLAAMLVMLSLGTGWVMALVLGYVGGGAIAMGLAATWAVLRRRALEARAAHARSCTGHREAGHGDAGITNG